MLVLLDIGNTRTKYCFVSNNQRTAQRTVLNQSLLTLFLSENFSGLTKVIVASVTNRGLTDKLSQWCQLNKINYQQVISEKKKGNVISGYKDPKQLGVDRWLALVGAAYLYSNQNLLIIDAGTATTVDLLAATGQHHGGWILAGIKTLISSVLAETSQVSANIFEKESIKFGTNTSENVHNAAWAATVGVIQLATSQLKVAGMQLDKIIITGGNANLLSSLIPDKNVVVEELVFIGLEAYL